MGTEIVMPGRGYPVSRRWARYKVDIPVVVTLPEAIQGRDNIIEGSGTALNCGGMTIFVPAELRVGDRLTAEFIPPYSSRTVIMNCVIRNRHIYSYGVEFIPGKRVA